MIEVLEGRFTFDFENNVSASYLVLKAGLGEPIQQYQVEMIKNNPHAGILDLDIQQRNDTVCLYYNISSKISLSQFLNKRKPGRNEVLEILMGIETALREGKNFFLSENSFLIHPDYIYTQPGKAEISLVYIPAALKVDIIKVLKDFIINLLMAAADLEDTASDNYMQRILAYAKLDTFNLTDFDKLLRELRIGKPGEMPARAAVREQPQAVPQAAGAPVQKPSASAGKQPPLPRQEPMPASGDAKGSGNTATPALSQPSRPPVPPRPGPARPVPPQALKPLGKETAGAKPAPVLNRDGTQKMVYKPVTLLLAGMLQILLAAAGILCAVVMHPAASDAASTYFGIVIVLLAVDFLALRKLLEKKNKVPKEIRQKTEVKQAIPSPVNVEMKKREIRNNPAAAGARPPVPGSNPGFPGTPAGLFDAPTEVLSGEGDAPTVVLVASEGGNPYLKSTAGGVVEEIPVKKPRFVIGRLKEQVDYVSQNSAVGKVHAEILYRDGRYFIKDFNSRNGTFVNGTRIGGGMEHEIVNGSRITFANSDYLFIIPEG